MALGPSKLNGKGALGDERAQESLRQEQRHRSEALAELCGALEDELEALRARYELYFIGVERREPARERGELKRRVARLKSELTSNTGLRFRIETLHARYLSYERMWVRNATQKEDGTYRRDLARARRKAVEREGRPGAPTAATDAASQSAAPGAPASAGPAASPAAPAAAAPAPPLAVPRLPRVAPPAPGLPVVAGGPGEEALRALHAQLVAARTACNEDVSRITPEALARTVAKQVPDLLAKYNARSVEYRVVVKDGRAVLKAVPRV